MIKKNGDKKEFAIEKEIELFCQDTAKVLTKIRKRTDEEKSKEQQKKKKTKAIIASE